MTLELQNEVRDLKRRLDLAETRLLQLEGRFEFIPGQLRDVQLYMHARFDDMDKRFERIDRRFEQVDKRFEQVDKRFEQVDRRFDTLDSKLDALPRVLAEMLAKR
jgi:chromosome segregation ATPase